MRRRGAIKDISYTLLDQFNSRNNDLGGYWAMGVLYKHALKNNALAVSLDLLGGQITPASKACEQVAQVYRTRLKRHLRKRAVPVEWIQSTVVNISFKDSTGAKPFRSACGDPYVCDVVIKCVSGCVKSSRRTGYCWPHDPKREQKSYSNEAWSLGLAGDGDDSDLIVAVTEAFKVEFLDSEVSSWYTVGDMYETLLDKHQLEASEPSEIICASHRAFNQLRRAINKFDPSEVRPDTRLEDLKLVKARDVEKYLWAVEHVRAPQPEMTLFGCTAWLIAVAAPLAVVAIYDASWLWALPSVAFFVELPKFLPSRYGGTVGELATKMAELNHGYYLEYGAKADAGSIWKSLETVCREYGEAKAEDRLTPTTFLLVR